MCKSVDLCVGLWICLCVALGVFVCVCGARCVHLSVSVVHIVFVCLPFCLLCLRLPIAALLRGSSYAVGLFLGRLLTLTIEFKSYITLSFNKEISASATAIRIGAGAPVLA